MSELTMLRHAFNKASNVLVITHIDPDGDAIGSLTAVGLALRQRGQPVTLVCDDAVPGRFAYLGLADAVAQAPDRHAEYDLLVAVDCGDEFRMGYAYNNLTEPRPMIVNIDHHVTNTRFGEINVVDPQATSTTEILYRVFTELDVEITEEIALSLLTGLVTDTLGFRTVGVTANTLRTAAALVDAGADLSTVTMQALNLRSWSTMQLWRIGLDSMQREDGLIWTTITSRLRREVDFRSNSSLGLVNLLADIEDAAMGVVIMEMDDGSVKVGFRCRPPYDVSEIAVELGGGGHPLASGCTLDGPLEEVETIVVNKCKEAIRRQAAAAQEERKVHTPS